MAVYSDAFKISVVRDERAMEEYAEPVAGHYLNVEQGGELLCSEPITPEIYDQLGKAYLEARRVVNKRKLNQILNHPLSVFIVTLLLLSPVLLPGGGL